MAVSRSLVAFFALVVLIYAKSIVPAGEIDCGDFCSTQAIAGVLRYDNNAVTLVDAVPSDGSALLESAVFDFGKKRPYTNALSKAFPFGPLSQFSVRASIPLANPDMVLILYTSGTFMPNSAPLNYTLVDTSDMRVLQSGSWSSDYSTVNLICVDETWMAYFAVERPDAAGLMKTNIAVLDLAVLQWKPFTPMSVSAQWIASPLSTCGRNGDNYVRMFDLDNWSLLTVSFPDFTVLNTTKLDSTTVHFAAVQVSVDDVALLVATSVASETWAIGVEIRSMSAGWAVTSSNENIYTIAAGSALPVQYLAFAAPDSFVISTNHASYNSTLYTVSLPDLSSASSFDLPHASVIKMYADSTAKMSGSFYVLQDANNGKEDVLSVAQYHLQ